MRPRRYDASGLGVNGWFAVSHAMFKHPIVGAGNGGSGGRYSRFEAWQWLISHACWLQEGAGELRRGELYGSIRALAHDWAWSHKAVRTFLGRLEHAEMVALRHQEGTRAQIITILNYARYQRWVQEQGTPEAHDGHTPGTEKGALYNKEHEHNHDLEALEAFTSYNSLALQLGLPQASTLTPSRRQLLKARLREHGGLTGWHRALDNLKASPFLRGENDSGFRANLDFVLRASSFNKLIDGSYYSKSTSRLGSPANTTTIRDTSESIGTYTARMIAEGKFKPSQGGNDGNCNSG